MTTAMQGKTVLVTGATSGIGKATAQALAQMGATLVIVGRNPRKTEQVAAEIRAMNGNSQVDYLLADLSVQDDIRRLASAFQSRYQQLHVLVNNAGAVFPKREFTIDGFEKTFAVNHLAYFHLTNLLLDTLKASVPARIVNVASGLYRVAKLDFDNLQGERSYMQFSAYNHSKLLNILFTVELTRRLEGSGVTANALNPGVVETSLQDNSSGMLATIVKSIVSRFSVPAEQGAATSIYLASSPEVESMSGKYFSKMKLTALKGIALDANAARRLWDLSADMVQLDTQRLAA